MNTASKDAALEAIVNRFLGRLDSVVERLDRSVRLHDPSVRGFASDNYSGVHPEVSSCIAEVGSAYLHPGHCPDDWLAFCDPLVFLENQPPAPSRASSPSRSCRPRWWSPPR